VDENAHGLQRVAPDVFGFILRLLVQQFDSGHFLSTFGHFDAVSNEHEPIVDAQWTGE
jgi:hypothetical protein